MTLPVSSTIAPNTRKDFKDIVKKMDGKKIHGALISVIRAFKEQGGGRSTVLDVVHQVYGDASAISHLVSFVCGSHFPPFPLQVRTKTRIATDWIGG